MLFAHTYPDPMCSVTFLGCGPVLADCPALFHPAAPRGRCWPGAAWQGAARGCGEGLLAEKAPAKNRNGSLHKEAKALFSSFIELWQIICVCGFYINSYK